MTAKVYVSWQESASKSRALNLAKDLNLDCIDLEILQNQNLNESDYILMVSKKRLELRQAKGKSKIFAEFLKGPLGYRRVHGKEHRELIKKAIGLKKSEHPFVIDATGGLGQDAFVLATLGCKLLIIERSAIIGALLKDGLYRAKRDLTLNAILDQVEVTLDNAIHFLDPKTLEKKPDVIYLDPMFPEKSKKALAKIEMRIIRDIVGSDEDANLLLKIALKSAKKRVVVKRPKHAESILKKTPDFVVEGRRNRYDVYLTYNLSKEV